MTWLKGMERDFEVTQRPVKIGISKSLMNVIRMSLLRETCAAILPGNGSPNFTSPAIIFFNYGIMFSETIEALWLMHPRMLEPSCIAISLPLGVPPM